MRRKADGIKRTIAVIVAAIVGTVVVPAVALAQDGSSLGKPHGPAVLGTGGSLGGTGGIGGGTAFTGAEIAGLVLFALVLVAIGTSAVLMARRRSVAGRPEV
jgi:hypothetical protein